MSSDQIPGTRPPMWAVVYVDRSNHTTEAGALAAAERMSATNIGCELVVMRAVKMVRRDGPNGAVIIDYEQEATSCDH